MSRSKRLSSKSSILPLLAFAQVLLATACGDLLGTGASGRPSILAVRPAPGQENVSVLETIRIEFSIPLDERTLSEGVSLKEGDHEIQVRLRLEGARFLDLEPTDPLDFGSSYRVTINESVRSRSGKPLSEQESWFFFTEGHALPAPDLDTLRATLEALAQDDMLGRGSGSESEKIAAGLISDRFKAYGLASGPAGWEQRFQALSRKSRTLISSQNVLASLPGAGDLAGEWVVVGAHYDHLGIRAEADGTLAIHNGADDNASGTALLLEVARILQAQISGGGIPAANRRSVLLVAFGAEEEGLLGSCHVALVSPAVPASLTRAMMNFDMVGRLRDDELQVRGFETSLDWPNMVENANNAGLLLLDPPPCEACSDFACFRDQGVPYIWFFTGTHAQYHTPEDDVELINFPGISKVGGLALRVLSRLLVMRSGPLTD